MSATPTHRRRIFAHIGSRTAARLALCAPAGWLVKTKLLLPVGETVELSLRLGDERRSLLVPATVVGRRPGEGILLRCEPADVLAADHADETPRPVTLTFTSYADLEDAVTRILCGQRILADEPVMEGGEVFLRLCIWGEPTARLAFPATVLPGENVADLVVRLDDIAARRAVRSFLHLTDGMGRAAV